MFFAFIASFIEMLPISALFLVIMWLGCTIVSSLKDEFQAAFPELEAAHCVQRRLYKACLDADIDAARDAVENHGAKLNSYCMALACFRKETEPVIRWLLFDKNCTYDQTMFEILGKDRQYKDRKLFFKSSLARFADIYISSRQSKTPRRDNFNMDLRAKLLVYGYHANDCNQLLDY